MNRPLRLVVLGGVNVEGATDAVTPAQPKRIVVKRPVGADPLAPGATRSVTGKTTRFDVYLTPAS